jgi:hypothetical protein
MSAFFNSNFLKPQYFNAKYLGGGNETQSGWRRLIVAQLQEADLKKRREKEAAEQAPVIEVVAVEKVKAAPEKKHKKRIKRVERVSEPEEEIAKEVLKVLPKPLYRESPRVESLPPEILVSFSYSVISELWVKLGILSTPVALSFENDLREMEEADAEDDETLLILLAAL